MIFYSQEQIHEAMDYSKKIIKKAENKDRSVFDFARAAGEKYFYPVEKLMLNDYIYAVNNVQYKLKGLEYLGKVAENDTAIYKELINVIKEQFGNLFKEMLEYDRVYFDFNK